MATLLTGESGHHTYAPLSHAQTLSICQHLENMIRELQTKTEELRRDLGHTDVNVAQLRTALGSTNAAVHTLQEGHVNSNNPIETLKKEQVRTGNKINKLGMGLEQVTEAVAGIRESNKVTDTSAAMLKQDFVALTERTNFLQKSLETNIAGDSAEQKEQLGTCIMAIKAIRQDLEKTKSGGQETKENLRITNGNLHTLNDEIAKANTVTGLIDQRLSEAYTNLKATRQNLAETNAVALRIHEDHKNTKSQLAATQEGVKKCSSHVKQVHEGLENTITKLHNNMEQAQKTHAGLIHTRDMLEKTRHQVNGLNEAHEMVSATTMSLQARLEDTHATVQSVKAGLKDTNSVVLPNLRMDFTRPWSTLSDNSTQRKLSARSPLKKSPPTSPGVSGMLESEQGDPFMS